MKTGVALLAYGTPESLDDVEPFLRDVMKHRAPTPPFVEEIRRRYARIGGRSPLMDITRDQARLLGERLNMPVAVGTLHGKPRIAEAIAQLKVDRAVGLVAAPHFAPLTTNAYRAALDANALFVESWHRQPALLDAWARRVRDADFVLFTAHSLPAKDADPYPAQLRETIAGICERVPGLRWDFAYQSRSPGPIPWLEPDVETKIDELHAEEVPRARVAPIGFITDNVEILYDLDVLHGEHAHRLGIRWSRAPMLNTDPLLIDAMAAAVREALS
ncbi:MAG: ferrochelatase [Planctomycetes bacterium]|nr:ferrochelatase [Planctomycetota bacterium]